MKDKGAVSKEIFDQQVRSYIRNEHSLELIQKAYDYAHEKHEGQFRRSGEPYFTHVLSVAYILATLNADPETVAGGLLHDVIEDCDVSDEDFRKEFGDEIYTLVNAVTKIGNLKFKDREEYQAANHRKIFIAMAKDVRVIMIKLVDRLHNMRTLQFQPREKQERIATETLEVYAPIAHRLGLAEIKNELEDLSFYYLNNDKYHEIAHLVENKKSERDQQVRKMIEEISSILTEHNIPFRIFGRSKHLYSIYRKMEVKHKRFDEILDLLAIRVITKSELNCYECLGYIHATYKPIPGRFKDYIAMPKVNLYQSLHTTIIGIDGKIFEVQIRTEEMDRIAERGIAAHWAYKEGQGAHHEQKDIVKELEWLKAFEEDEESKDANRYMSDIVNDIFNANIYVMTPKGRVIDLPYGSTPIDFAYRVHTEVGHQTVGALVNDVLVPLNSVLKTGDVVSIRTNKNSGPSEDWLKFVKTSNAKNKIRAYLTKKEEQERAETVKLGEKMLHDDIKRRGLNAEEVLEHKKVAEICPQLQVKDYNDLLYAVGCKSLTTQSVIEKLVKAQKKEVDEETLRPILEKNQNKRRNAGSKTDVIVKGIDSMKMQMSSCCKPVYGDPIIGYVTRGSGIRVHRKDCPNVLNEKARLIDVEWNPEKDPSIHYETDISIYMKDRNFLVSDIVTVIAQYKATMLAINVVLNQQDLTAKAAIRIVVDDTEQLQTLMANLRKIESVLSVDRVIK
ncbi:MAG: bifunctional (p)ppGpp synthetase/guanosine-3',5'-bis(diphosphate) 3'-pyrophosphohydrolase [Erysipelotrichaceae bacterium]|nr:bifunctional (p)ppGpp synthetase/guanosine-3',5'-bis(diphosphate) 3'-pyrophosphohydrolase [Erysipelotrichaceae bacterium]